MQWLTWAESRPPGPGHPTVSLDVILCSHEGHVDPLPGFAMLRRSTLSLLIGLVTLASTSALASDKKKGATSPMVGKWQAAATVDQSGNETPFPSREGDNTRVVMTLDFKADQRFEMYAKSVFKPVPGQELPKELLDEMNKEARTKGKWTLTGAELTIEPTEPVVKPKTTTTVTFKGNSFFMTVPNVGFIRFQRTR